MNIIGSRLFCIDKECYILYMGKPGRMHRPFLRIGNSLHIPQKIIPYIGTVVLSERLTGNIFLELTCLSNTSKNKTNYVGDHELISATSKFLQTQKIFEYPLNTNVKDKRNEGASVIYYKNNNLKISLDGHTLFDLGDREKSDLHEIELVSRIESYISSNKDALSSDDLKGKGFFILPNNTPILFNDGEITSCGFGEETLGEIAKCMIRPSFIRNFLGESQQNSLLRILKWQKLQMNPIRLYFGDSVTDTSGLPQLLYTYLKDQGMNIDKLSALPEDILQFLEIKQNTQNTILKFSKTPSPLSTLALQAPKNGAWYLSQPPIVQGIPYFVSQEQHGNENIQSGLEVFMESAGRDILDKIKEIEDYQQKINRVLSNNNVDDPIKLVILVYLWNSLHMDINTEKSPESLLSKNADLLRKEIAKLKVLLPLRAELYQISDKWTVQFYVKQGVSKQEFRSWNETRARVATLLQTPEPTEFFEQERQRLIKNLEGFIQQGSIETHDEVQEKILPAPSAEPPASTSDLKLNRSQSIPRKSSRKKGVLLGLLFLLFGISAAALVFFLFTPQGSQLIANVSGTAEDQQQNNPAESDIDISDSNAQSNDEDNDSSETESNNAQSNSDATEDGSVNNTSSTDSADNSTTANNATNENSQESEQGDQERNSQEQSTSEVESTVQIPEWTVIEILLIANWISFNNGYELLGIETVRDRDPDWIYPGNSLVLPNSTLHRVSEGDSIWFLADNILDELFLVSGYSVEEFRQFIDTINFEENIAF